MNKKVTTVRPQYPLGEEPNLCVPEKYNNYHRFLLGRLGTEPLVAVCMNPSAANEDYSDRTINKIINVSKKLGYDGWVVANVYPERATSSSDLDKFNLNLAEDNIQIVIEFDTMAKWIGNFLGNDFQELSRYREKVTEGFETYILTEYNKHFLLYSASSTGFGFLEAFKTSLLPTYQKLWEYAEPFSNI